MSYKQLNIILLHNKYKIEIRLRGGNTEFCHELPRSFHGRNETYMYMFFVSCNLRLEQGLEEDVVFH